jgi:hypothetical protein
MTFTRSEEETSMLNKSSMLKDIATLIAFRLMHTYFANKDKKPQLPEQLRLFNLQRAEIFTIIKLIASHFYEIESSTPALVEDFALMLYRLAQEKAWSTKTSKARLIELT